MLTTNNYTILFPLHLSPIPTTHGVDLSQKKLGVSALDIYKMGRGVIPGGG